ncbi:hypothetical protein ACN4EG_15670 [Alkalinema pantanalense CENA528]|uniref:hypothetical protein n=1 Tax=Alkalinema pantanalense TaxID=1620705 RepID=UPI003D6EA1E1
MDYQTLHISKTISIGTNLFQLSDPTDDAGTELPNFSLYQIYPVKRSKVEAISHKLYSRVFEKINGGSLEDAKVSLTKYEYVALENHAVCKDERVYIVVTREARHDSARATVFMRFHSYGDHLYVGINAYMLGRVKWSAILWRLLICLSVLTLLPLILHFFTIFSSFSGNSSSSEFHSFTDLLWWVIFPCLLVSCWWGVIKRMVQDPKKPVSIAFRQAFQGSLHVGSFGADDIMMFLKSTLNIGVMAVRDVFKEEGLPIETLDVFVQSINVNNVFQNSVGAVAGNVQGNFTISSLSE